MEWTPCGRRRRRRRYDRIVPFTPSLCVTLCVQPAAPKGSVAVKFTQLFLTCSSSANREDAAYGERHKSSLTTSQGI